MDLENENIKNLIQDGKLPLESCVTYHHPPDDFHIVHVWGKPISGEHKTRGAAILDAIEKYAKTKKGE